MNSSLGFQSIWEYSVRKEFIEEFTDTYGPAGEWVRLFQKCEGFIKTELKQDINKSNRFVTIDYWQSQKDFAAMKLSIGQEYDSLDMRCENFTTSENHIGYFHNV